MRMTICLCFLLILCPAMTVAAGNVVRQTLDAQNSANPRVACRNPRFNFSKQEIEVCIHVYQGCLRPDLRQSEREQCLIEAVKKGKISHGDPAGQGGDKKGNTLDFSFTPFQAYDLIELCEQRQNKNRQLCAGAILPNRAKIMSDINALRR